LLDYDLGESFRRTRMAAAAGSMAPLPSVMAFLPLLIEKSE
jgi:hypothetical protein